MVSTTETHNDLLHELHSAGLSRVDSSPLARGMYSSDASLYRVVPQAIVRAQDVDELHAAYAVARAAAVPLTMRGAGTSIAGNAVGEGIVVDTRDLNRVLCVDPEARTARVEPGVVHADLQRAAAPLGLRFGPDPSTHTRCTIGGMIGNNACGSRALGYGRTSDNVVGVSVLFGNGEQATLREGRVSGDTATTSRLRELAGSHLAHIRTSFGQFGRQISGYSLEHLLPENGGRVERLLTGSEGTLGLLTEAEVSLVADEPGRRLLVLGYREVAEAADAVPALLQAAPGRLIACEGMDSRLVALVRGAGKRVPTLPEGDSWLFVEVAGADALSVLEKVSAASGALDTRLIEDSRESAALWKIREDGAGLAGISLSTPAHSGWEDAAVPPEHLGAWMREFEALMREFGVQGYPYGHFGDGCIHCRIDFPFQHGDPHSTGVFREFMHAAAERLAAYGGSLSGEHGDGRVRSELLPLMYSDESLSLFRQVKAICDPQDLLNPGIIASPEADPVPITENIRPTQPVSILPWPGMRMTHDDGSFAAAAHRCSGVGRCVAPRTNEVMCPSYLATGEEKDSTRGRARILQEAMDGRLVHGLQDPAVHEALDLCLACKGCASDCPAGVDMATYKAETLYQTHTVGGVRRPRSHYVLGRLPFWARLSAPLAPVLNLGLKISPLAAVAKWVAGIDQRRSVPAFAARTLRRAAGSSRPKTGTPDVWVWADSFTDHFFPESGLSALEFLRSQGLRAEVIERRSCCGLPWITTGQLDQARRLTDRATTELAPYVDSGVPVIGLEPSCLATLRSDAVELSESAEARTVADGVLSFAELVNRFVDEGRVQLPDLSGIHVVAQPHCHQASVIGWDVDQALLEMAGATVTKVPGCCGLAGNFGVEKGHYETSVAVAETHLLPAVRAAAEDPRETVILADGMSCKVQLADLAGVRAEHLAQLLARS
ncbi:FAD-binding and (Fe-S)-binding domain-containing protein [Nesterenkonia flava]|uniref:FAD-binding and (Fe-S)-binding domain-containing protein n=1 Tax=Nesterenkonia flava TaxID=469799 RepID=A0ABU1FQK9_9MICC|nr:FAD-binding and (Fe-S)-binding domain-containing protein [Nesterenkonia flava]MDR5710937.1 FAD-binding and (Fe-S)-binding domain-containing protein [Nesterenkonia flava]